ncbi:hypothetical protein [Streptomyces virginiae]|uniref:hypothetical protein n=1 Tax=Streptomyces virginiae TaxID=1961 RepID=UPI003867F6FC|nr:hypothetical protein OG253_41930 [Streptomyces virginiae]
MLDLVLDRVRRRFPSCSSSSPQYRFIASTAVAVPCSSKWNDVPNTIAWCPPLASA